MTLHSAAALVLLGFVASASAQCPGYPNEPTFKPIECANGAKFVLTESSKVSHATAVEESTGRPGIMLPTAESVKANAACLDAALSPGQKFWLATPTGEIDGTPGAVWCEGNPTNGDVNQCAAWASQTQCASDFGCAGESGDGSDCFAYLVEEVNTRGCFEEASPTSRCLVDGFAPEASNCKINCPAGTTGLVAAATCTNGAWELQGEPQECTPVEPTGTCPASGDYSAVTSCVDDVCNDFAGPYPVPRFDFVPTDLFPELQGGSRAYNDYENTNQLFGISAFLGECLTSAVVTISIQGSYNPDSPYLNDTGIGLLYKPLGVDADGQTDFTTFAWFSDMAPLLTAQGFPSPLMSFAKAELVLDLGNLPITGASMIADIRSTGKFHLLTAPDVAVDCITWDLTHDCSASLTAAATTAAPKTTAPLKTTAVPATTPSDVPAQVADTTCRATGDPHYYTWAPLNQNGPRYDFQGEGRFWLMQCEALNFGIQSELFSPATSAAAIQRAFTLTIGGAGSVLEVRASTAANSALVQSVTASLDGAAPLAVGSSAVYGSGQWGARVTVQNRAVTIAYANGGVVKISAGYWHATWYLNIQVDMVRSIILNKCTGLCGAYGNLPANIKFCDGQAFTNVNDFGLCNCVAATDSDFANALPTTDDCAVVAGNVDTTCAVGLQVCREQCSLDYEDCIFDVCGGAMTQVEAEQWVAGNAQCQPPCNPTCVHGLCTNSKCQCFDNWTGANCNVFVGNPIVCQNGGRLDANGLCVCPAGFGGDLCQNVVHCRHLNLCSNNGKCVDNGNGQGVCVCAAGWGGLDCSTPPSCVELNNCSGHGACVATNQCQCEQGWTGPNCGTQVLPPVVTDAHCQITGDPHFTTFDGRRFDYQGAGRFWAMMCPDLPFSIQIETFDVPSRPHVSMQKAIAVKFGSNTLEVIAFGSDPNNAPGYKANLHTPTIVYNVANGFNQAVGSGAFAGRVSSANNQVYLDIRAGARIRITRGFWGGRWYLNLFVDVDRSVFRGCEGLCGNLGATNPITCNGQVHTNFNDFGLCNCVEDPAQTFADPLVTTNDCDPAVTRPPQSTQNTVCDTGVEVCQKHCKNDYENCVFDVCVLGLTAEEAVIAVSEMEQCQSQCPGVGGVSCSGHGRCLDGKCHCAPGWIGVACENGAVLPACLHGKATADGWCVCEDGWTGNLCDVEEVCDPAVDCSGHGDCKDDTCVCHAGWAGADCSQAPNCAGLDNCSGHGICIGTNQCQCDRAWTGRACNVAVVPAATADVFCSATGDPHYTTFDGGLFHYQGQGVFRLTQCDAKALDVQVENLSHFQSKHVSLQRAVTIGFGHLFVIHAKVPEKLASGAFDPAGLSVNSEDLTALTMSPLAGNGVWNFAAGVWSARVTRSGNSLNVNFKNGAFVNVVLLFWRGVAYLNIRIGLNREWALDKCTGLCGTVEATDPMFTCNGQDFGTDFNAWGKCHCVADRDLLQHTRYPLIAGGYSPCEAGNTVDPNVDEPNCELGQQICAKHCKRDYKNCVFDVCAVAPNDHEGALALALGSPNCQEPCPGTPQQCSGNGRCFHDATGPHCDCLPGFGGADCSLCKMPACVNGKPTTDCFCQCAKGWTGPLCDVPATCPNCGVHGTCVEGQCVCKDGWTGPLCDVAPTCPALNNCNGHGVCVGKDLCKCNAGWTGRDCNTAVIAPPANPDLHCRAWGDPHFVTWTGHKFDYQGVGRFFLMKCPTQKFAVQIETFSPAYRPSTSLIGAMAFNVGATIVEVRASTVQSATATPNFEVFVGGVAVTTANSPQTAFGGGRTAVISVSATGMSATFNDGSVIKAARGYWGSRWYLNVDVYVHKDLYKGCDGLCGGVGLTAANELTCNDKVFFSMPQFGLCNCVGDFDIFPTANPNIGVRDPTCLTPPEPIDLDCPLGQQVCETHCKPEFFQECVFDVCAAEFANADEAIAALAEMEHCAANECPGTPACGGRGFCNAGVCQCHTGWEGIDCGTPNVPTPQCVHGKADARGFCRCEPGWIGRLCEIPDQCEALNFCSGHGVCRTGQCFCRPGFLGKDCSQGESCAVDGGLWIKEVNQGINLGGAIIHNAGNSVEICAQISTTGVVVGDLDLVQAILKLQEQVATLTARVFPTAVTRDTAQVGDVASSPKAVAP